MTSFSLEVIRIIKRIPKGRVATYGQVAKWAGAPRSSRQVAWILHSSTRKYRLPWHRVINSQGKISLPEPLYSQQKRLLKKEGIEFSDSDRISLKLFGLKEI